mgnify:CR=1 FL=1
MQPLELSAIDLIAALRQGDVTAVQCTTAFLDRIESANGAINAFLAVDRMPRVEWVSVPAARTTRDRFLGKLGDFRSGESLVAFAAKGVRR